jgi:hypothetical protein
LKLENLAHHWLEGSINRRFNEAANFGTNFLKRHAVLIRMAGFPQQPLRNMPLTRRESSRALTFSRVQETYN